MLSSCIILKPQHGMCLTHHMHDLMCILYAFFVNFQMHLFDIDIPGKITFQESKTLTAGNSFVTFDTRKVFFFQIIME